MSSIGTNPNIPTSNPSPRLREEDSTNAADLPTWETPKGSGFADFAKSTAMVGATTFAGKSLAEGAFGFVNGHKGGGVQVPSITPITGSPLDSLGGFQPGQNFLNNQQNSGFPAGTAVGGAGITPDAFSSINLQDAQVPTAAAFGLTIPTGLVRSYGEVVNGNYFQQKNDFGIGGDILASNNSYDYGLGSGFGGGINNNSAFGGGATAFSTLPLLLF